MFLHKEPRRRHPWGLGIRPVNAVDRKEVWIGIKVGLAAAFKRGIGTMKSLEQKQCAD